MIKKVLSMVSTAINGDAKNGKDNLENENKEQEESVESSEDGEANGGSDAEEEKVEDVPQRAKRRSGGAPKRQSKKLDVKDKAVSESEPKEDEEAKDESVTEGKSEELTGRTKRQRSKKQDAEEVKEKSKNKENDEPAEEAKDDKTEPDEDGNYEVEQIVDMEVNQRWKCPVRFRVRWLGYGEKDDSYLPVNELDCDDLVKEFLEISGRNPEYKNAMEAKKAEEEEEAARIQTRKRNKNMADYEESDEDEYIPAGTSTRKLKSPPKPVKIPKAKKAKKASNVYEVKAIMSHRRKGKVTEFKVRWKGFSSKDDSWLPESELHCPQIIKKYYDSIEEEEESDEEEAYEVQEILKMRKNKKKNEYLVRWKGYSAKFDSWLPESELDSCPEIMKKFKDNQSTDEKSTKSNVQAKSAKAKPASKKSDPKKGKNAKNKENNEDSAEATQNSSTRGSRSRGGKNRSYSEFYEQ